MIRYFEPGDLIELIDSPGRWAVVLYEHNDGDLAICWESGYAEESRLLVEDHHEFRKVCILTQMMLPEDVARFTPRAERCPHCYRPMVPSGKAGRYGFICNGCRGTGRQKRRPFQTIANDR